MCEQAIDHDYLSLVPGESNAMSANRISVKHLWWTLLARTRHARIHLNPSSRAIIKRTTHECASSKVSAELWYLLH